MEGISFTPYSSLSCVILWMLWMDEIHFAPPKKPWKDDYPVNTHKQWFPRLRSWCRIWSIHSRSAFPKRPSIQGGRPPPAMRPPHQHLSHSRPTTSERDSGKPGRKQENQKSIIQKKKQEEKRKKETRKLCMGLLTIRISWDRP